MINPHVQSQFPGAAGYLNTASLGLPPLASVSALQAAITDWQAGRAEPANYDEDVAAARRLFAGLVSTPVEWVAVGSQVSALVGMVATALRPGARVVCPEGEFTSVFFPFLARNDLDVDVEFVPLEQLPSSIGPGTDLVAFSAVQSADGRVADLEAIRTASAASGALTLVDATQAIGWLPIDATEFDFTVTGAYKWLLSPRGTAFMTIRPELVEQVQPLYAGWYAGDDPWKSIYGMPMQLASDARRFDLSPGWLAWVGTVSALRLVDAIGIDAIHDHNVDLANSFLTQLGMEPSNSAIVSLDLGADFEAASLDGFSTAYRSGRLRVSFHLYNTGEDVNRLARVTNR
ncbi:MAG: aminotransferase class V-fold PLP-dependent enzyme [Actinomycetia bacterium]|nr:aminotransferase class V-fold PLP-dependent enzyme [Actinomycetes bacterium]